VTECVADRRFQTAEAEVEPLAIRHQAATGVWSFALEDLYRLSFSGRVETLLFADLKDSTTIAEDQGPVVLARVNASVRAPA